MESFFTDLPTLPSLSTLTEEKMSSNRLIQPIDLEKYQLPSLPASELSSPVQVQVSNDRSYQQHHGGNSFEIQKEQDQYTTSNSPPSNFSLSPPQLMQTSHSAPSSANPYQPSFAFTLNNQNHHQIPNYDQRRNPFQYNQQQQPILTQNQNQNLSWTEKGFNTQFYDSPYLQQSIFKPTTNHIQHNHSHSTPNNSFSTPYHSHSQSQSSTPFQGTNNHSQLSLTPYQLPIKLQDFNDIPLPLQPNENTDYSLPEGRWESNAPYLQPNREDTPSSPVSERRAKKKDMMVKSRKHICPVCDKRFNRPSSLNTHMAVHTGAKPYICTRPECQRRFSVSSNLRRHERTHELRAEKERQCYGSPLARTAEPQQSNHIEDLNYLRGNQTTSFSQPIHQVLPFTYTHYQPTAYNSSSSQIYNNQPNLPATTQYGLSTSYSSSGSSGSMSSNSASASATCSGSNSNFNSNTNSGYGGMGGLAQYQVVTRRKDFTNLEMPRKSFLSMNDVELDMDTKAGLLLA